MIRITSITSFTIVLLEVLVFNNILASTIFTLESYDNLSHYNCFNVAAALVALNHNVTT